MMDYLASMAAIPAALRRGGWKRDDEIEAGMDSHRTFKGEWAVGKGIRVRSE